MTARSTHTKVTSLAISPNAPIAPPAPLSNAGWEGVVSYGFHEPRGMEGWKVSPNSDLMLMVYAGGPIHIERQWAHGSWSGEDLQPGDLVVHWGEGAAYTARWWSLRAVSTRALDLHLSRQLVNGLAQELLGTDLARVALERQTVMRDPLLTQMALALWQELEQPVRAENLYVQTAAQFLAAHLVRQLAASSGKVRGGPPVPGGLTDRQIKQVLEFIRTHLSEDLSLEALAQQTGFSAYHFARLFRRVMDVSPHQFVLRQRIEYAQRLLRETNLPLAQIAQACGFSDQSHLTLVFTQQLGCTPRTYRQIGPMCARFWQQAAIPSPRRAHAQEGRQSPRSPLSAVAERRAKAAKTGA